MKEINRLHGVVPQSLPRNIYKKAAGISKPRKSPSRNVESVFHDWWHLCLLRGAILTVDDGEQYSGPYPWPEWISSQRLINEMAKETNVVLSRVKMGVLMRRACVGIEVEIGHVKRGNKKLPYTVNRTFFRVGEFRPRAVDRGDDL